MTPTKAYTPWRRFLAWVGLCAIVFGLPVLITLTTLATYIVNASLRDTHAMVAGREALIERCRLTGGEPLWDANYPILIECDYDHTN